MLMKNHFCSQKKVGSSAYNPKAIEFSPNFLQPLLCYHCICSSYFFLQEKGFKKEQVDSVDTGNKKPKPKEYE